MLPNLVRGTTDDDAAKIAKKAKCMNAMQFLLLLMMESFIALVTCYWRIV
jgi:hypothetical protein